MYLITSLLKIQEVHNHILWKDSFLSVLADNFPEANTLTSFLYTFQWLCKNTFTNCSAYVNFHVFPPPPKRKKKNKSSKGFKTPIIIDPSPPHGLYGSLRLCSVIKRAALFVNGWLKGTKRNFAYLCPRSELFLVIVIINYLKMVNELKSFIVIKHV